MSRKPKRAVLEVWLGDKQNPQLRNCFESPTDAEIIEQLNLLPGGDQISSIELHISKTHHIAVGGSVKEGFHARYHEFSRAGEWESVRDDLSLESAANLVASYLDQIKDWKQLIKWKRRAIAPELRRERDEHDAQKIALWFAKGVAFVIGFLFPNSTRLNKRRRR